MRSRGKLVEFLVALLLVLGIRGAAADALGSISGRTTAGAKVTISCGTVTRTLTADAAGAFSASGLPAGECTVTASAVNALAKSARVTVAAGGNASITIVLPNPKPIEAEKRPESQPKRMPAKPSNPSPAITAMPPPAPPPPPGMQQIAGNKNQLDDDGKNTEQYARIDDNPFFRTQTAPLSTFSADVDTASYSNLRRFLREGSRPPKDAVRIEEMINYFSYDYPQPAKGDPFSITTDIGASPWNAKHMLVRIGLKAPVIDDRQVPARNLVFLLDVSGSMGAANKLPLLKQAMGLLVETMRPNDKVSIVVYAGASGVALQPTAGTEKDKIRQAIFALESGGSTNGAEGIQLAYNLAEKTLIKNGINRVILCTDGDFNVGITNEGDLTRLIEKERERGVFLTVLGFGMGNVKDATLEKLADRGNGNYGYIDSIFEARKVLVKEAGATLVTVAKDVKLQVEFNPSTVAGYRLIGYENRIMRHEDFNDDKKDAGDIGAGHSVTALYEVVPAGVEVPSAKVDALKYQKPGTAKAAQGSGELMTVKVRYKAPNENKSKLLERAVAGASAAMSKDFQWATAIAGFGMLLRDSPHRGNLTWKQVQALAEGALGEDKEGYRKQALEMIRAAAKM
jgi:Ca-activated chloride channel homolog